MTTKPILLFLRYLHPRMERLRTYLKIKKALELLVDWSHRRLPGRQFLIAASIFVGFTTGLAAVLLKTLVHYIHVLIELPAFNTWISVSYFLLPTVGLLLTVTYIRKFNKGKLGRGAANILYAIGRKSSILPKDQMYSHIFSSALTVGFGGSAGLESPIVSTGAAIGSNFARTYKIPYKERTLLLACGAAAGIGATFNAPIAGVLFAIEVLLTDLYLAAFIPLLIAAATGALCSEIILGDDILLSFNLQQKFSYYNVPAYMLLGVFCGLVSFYYAGMFLKTEKRMEKYKLNPYFKAVFGGILLGFMLLVFPALFGEGYFGIKQMANINGKGLFQGSLLEPYLNGGWLFVATVGILLLKPVAAALTLSSGGNGGNFAPSLLMGATTGFLFANALYYLGFDSIPITNFTLVGMAGILSGIFHAPLSAIFLIAEITGGYELMIPLMMVSALSFAVVKNLDPLSIEAKKLKQMGQALPQDKDTHVLNTLRTVQFINVQYTPLEAHMPLKYLVQCISQTVHDVFPVLKDEKLIGLVWVDPIRELLFRPEMYLQVQVEELMQPVGVFVKPDEEMAEVMKKFDEHEVQFLPVLMGEKFMGFIHKKEVLEKYRSVLRLQNTEN